MNSMNPTGTAWRKSKPGANLADQNPSYRFAGDQGTGVLLPLHGEVQALEGTRVDGGTSYTLPPISKSAAFGYEPAF
jgi:hypothetical protein